MKWDPPPLSCVASPGCCAAESVVAVGLAVTAAVAIAAAVKSGLVLFRAGSMLAIGFSDSGGSLHLAAATSSG